MKRSINGVDLAYDDHGAGIPVMFLHAFPLNRNMWTGQITALLAEQRWRLVALDWRGFGESVLKEDVTTMEALADDVVGLMGVLGMERAIFCGLSMGGYVAFALLRKYPQRVGGLILADTKPVADDAAAKENREKLAQLAETQGTGAIADLQIPRLLAASTRQHHQGVEARVRQMIGAATPQGIAAASRGMGQRRDATDLLASISCPTCVLVGENDVLTPPEVAYAYAQQIPNARVALIPQAGHLANLEQPEVFFEVVRNFLLSEF